jgi:signal transduction histidine kinase
MQAHKMEGIGRLAGGVAHDFNNLLAVIGGSADMIRDIVGAGHPAQAEIEDILAAAERGSALTRQLLALGRDQPSTLQLFDLNNLLTSSERLLLRLLPSETRLQLNLLSSGGIIRADPDQLTQVLMNLVINANDAMPNGGQITISTAMVVVTPGEAQAARALQSGPHILLTVGDTGTGMDEETLRKVFEPFFTTKPVSQGSGLGLAICYSIIRRHGGRIVIDSEWGRGTAVRIYLPLAMHLADAALVA